MSLRVLDLFCCQGGATRGYQDAGFEGDFYHAVGNFSNVPYVRTDMGMPWASREGIREAIPPAYSEFIGEQFLAQLERGAA